MTAAPKAHDRRKEYILAEGENIPALVDLGVFTPDLRIVKAKYDKYKQINRFIELVDDAFRASEQQEITILDFGCGKSYLTFILYYYFTVKRGVKATILGYDLKEDVVEHCNAIAQKYGYDGLGTFLDAGCVYVYAGFRGRSAGYDSSTGSTDLYPGGAPWPVVDLKAAIRYLRYNKDALPCDTSRVFSFALQQGRAALRHLPGLLVRLLCRRRRERASRLCGRCRDLQALPGLHWRDHARRRGQRRL